MSNPILTDADARELVSGFDNLPEAEKPRASSLLKAYADSKASLGLKPFQEAPGVSRSRRERFEALYADSKGMAGVLPEGERAAFEQAASQSLDGEEAKMRAVNQTFLAESHRELANPAMLQNWPAVRKAYAKQVFGIDKPEVPESELFSLIGGKLTKEKGERDMLAGAFQSLMVEAGKGDTAFHQAWSKVASGLNGNEAWDGAKHDSYRRLARKVWEDAQNGMTPLRPAIDAGKAYYSLAAQGEVQKDGKSNFGEIAAARTAFVQSLLQLDQKQREAALGFAIASAGEIAPKPRGEEGSASGVEKTAVQLERAIGGFGGNIARIAQQSAGVVAPYYAKATLNAQYDEREVMRLVDEGLADAIDPIKSKSRIVQGVYDAVDSLPYMAVSMVAYAGIPLTLAAMAEDNRAKFVANGVPKDQALGLALIAAAPQVGIERLQASMLFKGKVPGFEKWLGKPVTSKAQLAGKMAAVFGIETVQQNLEEGLQDITPMVTQDIAAMLTASVPDVDWSKELAAYGKGRVDTFFAMLPLVLIGTGTASFKEAAYGRQYLSDKTVLTAAGFSPEVVEKIATAETLEAKETLVRDEWSKRVEAAKAETDAAAADVGSMDAANSEAQAEAFAQLDEDMKASYAEQSAGVGGASAIRQDDGSFAVLDRDGNLIDVAFSAEAAVELVDEVNRADDLDMSQAIADMVDYFNGANEPGQSIEVTGERRTVQDKVDAGEMTQEEAQRAVDVAVAMGRLVEGSTPADAQIQGENVSLFNARTGLFEDVSRIYEGADPLVVVEERSEGYLKRRLEDGSLDEKTLQRWRDEVDGPQKDNSRRSLIEWFSSYAKAYMVGNADTEGVPSSFRAFLRALKDYLGEVLGMAKKLREMQASGQMEDFRQHLAQAVGLDRSWLEAKERDAERKASGPDRSQYSARAALLEMGLPTPGKETGGFNGELKTIWESLNFGQRMRLFSGTEKSLDDIATALRADYGFSEVNTPDDVIKLAERVFVQGEEVMSSGSYETDVTLPDGARLVGPSTFSLKAYHGTPHKVDKFTTSKIGTGEGAQAYGWGLYFAENPGVADFYRRNLSTAKPISTVATFNGRLLEDVLPDAPSVSRKLIAGALAKHNGDLEAVIAEWSQRNSVLSKQALPFAEKLRGMEIVMPPDPGNLYTVELLGDAEDFLDWDAPLSQQSEKVRAGFFQALGRTFEPAWDMTGGEMYRMVMGGMSDSDFEYLKGEVIARTNKLVAAGIKGVRYLDEKSRGIVRNKIVGPNDPVVTRNYVIFDESLVRILEENGKPVGEAATTFSLAPAVESEAFKKWFGDSKVVDAEGKPLVVYHGTGRDFTRFDKRFAQDREGRKRMLGRGAGKFYFTEHADNASAYARSAPRRGLGDFPAVYPVYLSMQNPIEDVDYMKRVAQAGGVESIYSFKTPEERDAAFRKADAELKAEGYDGVIDQADGIFMPFSGTQIKSAIGNRGTFDGSNPDITFAITSQSRIDEVERVLKERKVSNRINTSEHQGEAFSSVLQGAMANVTYEVQGDEASKERVSAYLNANGMEKALTLFMSELELNGSGKDWVVLGSSLVRALDKAGRYGDAQIAANRLAERGTSAGQTVQAFSLFGQTVDSLEKALVMFSRENRLKAEGIKRATPAIEASKEELKKLFTEDEIAKRVGEFINRLNGITLKTKKPVRVEDLPEVTFSLSPAVRASGLLTTVAGMLRESDYFDVRNALVEKYGDNVKPHLEEVLVEAQVLNQKRKASSKAQKPSQKRSEKAGDTKTPPEAPNRSEAEISAALDEAAQDAAKRREQVTFSELEGLTESFEAELNRRLKERSMVVPTAVREANRSLLEGMKPTAEAFDKAFSKAYGKRFNVQKLTDSEVQRLGELAQNIRSTPENSQERLAAVIELNSFVLDRIQPFDGIDVAFSLWYSGVLSGIPTTIRNVLGNTSFLLGTLAQFPMQQSPKDFLRSLANIGPAIQDASGMATSQAKNALLKGRGESALMGDEKARKRVLETVPMRGPWKAAKYVTRFLAAQDSFFSTTAYELKARQVALEMARSAVERGDINEEQLAAEIERLLNNTTEQIADFTARAEKEWDGLTDELKGRNERETWIKERVGELRMKERNSELVQRATRAAERATFNYAPEGILGVFLGAMDAGFGQAERLSKDAASPSARRVGRVIAKFGKAQIIPFFRVPVNVFNQALDYTPAGLARYLAYGHFGRWVTEGGRPRLEQVSADERAETLNKALIGLASAAVLMLTTWPDDEDQPWLQIHGAGSGKPNTDAAKNGPNWQPWSLEVRTENGSTFFSYKLLPFAPLLAGIGFVHDRARYKDTQDKDVGLFSFMQGMMASFLAQSPMQGLQELAETSTLDRLRKEESMRKVMGRAAVGFATNAAIPLANFWRSVDRMTALDTKRQQDTAAAAMLAQVPFGEHANRPRVDLLGDSIENRAFDWLFTQMDAGTPEGRIYRILGEKNVTPADSYGWKAKMEPEQFYEFTRFRGQFIKDALTAKGERLLNTLKGLPSEAAQQMMDDIARDATEYAKFKVGYLPKTEKN